jgi:hypothetical protein
MSSPLWNAVNAGDAAAVRQLLNSAECVNERHATSNLTPLMVASDLGHVDVVAALLDARAALEDTARFGETALLFAVLKSRESVVDALLAAGASLRARCVEGTPALAAAFVRNWPLAVRLLLLDAEFDAKDGLVMVRRAAKDSMAALDAVRTLSLKCADWARSPPCGIFWWPARSRRKRCRSRATSVSRSCSPPVRARARPW